MASLGNGGPGANWKWLLGMVGAIVAVGIWVGTINSDLKALRESFIDFRVERRDVPSRLSVMESELKQLRHEIDKLSDILESHQDEDRARFRGLPSLDK